MGCEGATACEQRECFLVELLSSTHGAASRRTCAVHLAAAVTWAHEIAALRFAVHPEAAPSTVRVTPIPDVDHGGAPQGSETAASGGQSQELPYDDEERRLLELELIAAAIPPGRDEPGLVAWTQRAFHRPGYFPPSRGNALAGLIFWPLATVAIVILAIAVKPPLVTPTAVRHAMDSRFYPTARDELVVRSLCCLLVAAAAWLGWYTLRSYWVTRPVRTAQGRPSRDLTRF